MEKIYADLIKKGKKTIEDVPKILREKVQAILGQETAD
ncbi:MULTISPECIES: CD1375 family protein [Enterococcus]|nr:CD1375 family protein [Enterococcus faecium]MDF3825562.1 CD1375 family protein [Enterococcus faecium]MDQ8218108.1 CD1375 family protein [Enterococcus faecium]MDQ8230244.1 CD1375 family protein [Enterococcus faecium]MDQ8252606.1 CD1375 family protein [Enterococcus faecium]MDQ8291671.1 CD1375 family protein [Enterococcus faecium]